MPTVTDRIFEFCRGVGLTTMFGNPGSTEEPMLRRFPPDFRYILGLHEASVVNMATGFALARDSAALVNLHTAAGMGNAMAAIMNAWHSKAPLVITAGQQHRAMERIEPLLWGRQVEMARPYVKWSFEPHRTEDVPETIARAHHLALSHPRGPVFVSIPMDGLDDEAITCPPVIPRVVDGAPAPAAATLDRLAAVLDRADRVAIVAGEELDDPATWPKTITLAERLRAGVFGPPENFRVAFPTDHPQFQGFLPPAIRPLGEKLAGFDALLVLGTRMFAYYPYVPGPFFPEGLAVCHVTSDPEEAARAVAGDSIVGCARAAVGMLLDRLRDRADRPAPPARPTAPAAEAADPIPAAFVYRTLAEVLPPDAVVVDESLSSLSQMLKLVPFRQPGGFYSTGNGILGTGLPLAVGAKLARPDRPTVCLLGDGAAQYSIQGLWTAARHKLPVVFVVMDNREYAILKAFGKFLDTPGVPGLDLGGIDFAGLARGYGLAYHPVADAKALGETLRHALREDAPSVVHVPIDPAVPPLIG